MRPPETEPTTAQSSASATIEPIGRSDEPPDAHHRRQHGAPPRLARVAQLAQHHDVDAFFVVSAILQEPLTLTWSASRGFRAQALDEVVRRHHVGVLARHVEQVHSV
jgi:hypothetical protein